MTTPLTYSLSGSSDYFDNDPDFLRALQEVALPGDVQQSPQQSAGASSSRSSPQEPPPSTQPSLKRRRSADEEDEEGVTHHRVISSIDQNQAKAGYLTPETYGASKFGDWGQYMSRKRAKLQVQNTEIDEDSEEVVQKSRIFRGLEIYVRLSTIVRSGTFNSQTPECIDQRLYRAICSGSSQAHYTAWWHIPRVPRQEISSVSSSAELYTVAHYHLQYSYLDMRPYACQNTRVSKYEGR